MHVELKDYCHHYTDGNTKQIPCGDCYFLGLEEECRIYLLLLKDEVYG